MKHERMTFSLCLAAVIMASVVSFASVMCLAETFDLNCSPRQLMIVCCLVAGAAVLVLSLKHSWIYGCTALAIYLFLLIWKNQVLLEDLETFLYHVSSEYARCFQVTVLGVDGGDSHALMAVVCMPLAWLCAWVVCREGSAVVMALACAPIYVLCLIVVDLAPERWLILLTGALLLLFLTGSVRSGSANEGGRLIWWLAGPVILVFFGLILVSPNETYVRSDWSQNLQHVVQRQFDLQLWEKRISSASVSGKKTEKINLNRVGPQKKTGTYIMEYSAGASVRYLREMSYGVYEDNTWRSVGENIPSLARTPLLMAEDAQSTALQISTPKPYDVIYTTYPLAGIPDGSVPVEDAYIRNAEKTKQYEVLYTAQYGTVIGQEETYRQFVRSHYLQLPESLKEQLQQILDQNGLSGKEQIIDFVRQCGVYDLNTKAVPAGEDFALYFLTRSHQGYCVHFATSAVLLLRAAGIPARYVTGYSVSGQEGIWNDVTQDDAHAWVECYEESFGWIPLEPTPVDTQEQPLTPAEPEQTEPVREPSKSTVLSGQEKDFAQQPQGKRNAALWLFLLPAAVMLLLLRRWVILYCRRIQAEKLHPNKQTLAVWNRLVRLHKALGTTVDERWLCLAEKAKFSNHVISREELANLNDTHAEQVEKMSQLPVVKKLWYRYGPVLY